MRSVMICDRETWAMCVDNYGEVQESREIDGRIMFLVSFKYRMSSDELMLCLSIGSMAVVAFLGNRPNEDEIN